MPTFKEVVEGHRALVALNVQKDIERAEAARNAQILREMAVARPYLDVLAALITPEEFERQLNADPTTLREKHVRFDLSEEAQAAFKQATQTSSLGFFLDQEEFLDLADRSGSPLGEVLHELIDQGFKFGINNFAGFYLTIWCPEPQA